MGVLICGKSGIGKSELALGLINQKHCLIADDAVLFKKDPENDTLMGYCPPVLQDFLEVRGIGILNIRVLFGESTIRHTAKLTLIVKILQITEQKLQTIDRLCGIHETQEILGIPIASVTIPLMPGRNLAVLVESAVRNHALKLQGYHAGTDFTQRHNTYMQKEHLLSLQES